MFIIGTTIGCGIIFESREDLRQAVLILDHLYKTCVDFPTVAFLGDERVPEDERNNMITALKTGARAIIRSGSKPRIVLSGGGEG